MSLMWGLVEWNPLDKATVTVGNLDHPIQNRLEAAWQRTGLDELRNVPLNSLTPEDQQTVIRAIGQRTQTEIYRQLLLGVISELWVDYLTKVEALRVSIGLEAYAQRDPLVMYKGQASEMFKELLSDIRAGVISRMFTYRPRQVTSTPEREEAPRPAAAGNTPAGIQKPHTSSGSQSSPKDGGGLSQGKAEASRTPAGVQQPSTPMGVQKLQVGGKKKRKRH
jgi:preprotein translocase subunit SecA